MNFMREHGTDKLASGDNIRGDVLIDGTAKVDLEALVGPNVAIGAGCVVGKGTRL